MKISIIIPIYNCEKYINTCLSCLCNQTYKDIEVICIDDGSTDSSLQIIKKFAEKDNRIKYITQKNQGISISRNNGIDIATGDYITFLDADDFIMLTTYEKCVNAIQNSKKPIDIIIFNGILWFEKINYNKGFHFLYQTQYYGDLNESNIKSIKQHSYPLQSSISVWNKLFKKDFILNNNFKFIPNKLAQDRLFSAQTYLATDNIYIMNDYLYCYKQQNNSITAKYNKNNYLDVFEIYDHVKNEYINNNFYTQNKISFLKYIIKETLLVILRCDLNLTDEVIKQSRKRLYELSLDKIPSDLKEIYEDINKLDGENFVKKYNNYRSDN